MEQDTKDFWYFGGGIIIVLFMIGILIWGLVAVGQIYGVWASGKQGEARLAEATYSRQIAVKEADAKAAAAVELAKAEIIRAKGVATSNKIIGQSLNKNEAYLRYLWIQTLESQNNKVIYIPTEANIPILEASRLNKSAHVEINISRRNHLKNIVRKEFNQK